MDRAKRDLIRYLNHSSEQNPANPAALLLSAIREFKGLDVLLCEELRSLDEDAWHNALERMADQKSWNAVMRAELVTLANLAEQRAIKFIYLKGLSLAEDLYEPVERRRQRDIDLLVGNDDLEQMLALLAELGYVDISTDAPVDMPEGIPLDLTTGLPLEISRSRPVSPDLVNNVYDSSVVADLAHLARRVPGQGKYVSVVLDLHLGLFLKRWYESVADTKRLLERSVRGTIGGQAIWLLELHDRIIHLLVGFSQDYSYDAFIDVLNGGKAITKIHQLHDAALLLDKYAPVIRWDELLNRSLQLHTGQQLLFAIRLLARIYPGRIPDGFVEELRGQVNRDPLIEHALPMEGLFPIFTTLDPDQLIHTELSHLAANVLHQLEQGHPELHCPALLRLSGHLHIEVLSRALEETLTCYYHLSHALGGDEERLPVPTLTPAAMLPVIDLVRKSKSAQEAKLRDLVVETIQRPFDLAHGPLVQAALVRLNEKEHVLFLSAHPSVFDRRSREAFGRDLGMHYRELVVRPTLPPSAYVTSSDVESKEQLADGTRPVDIDYWKQKLGKTPSALSLPTDRPHPARKSVLTRNRPFVLAAPLADAVQRLSLRANVAPFEVLLAAFEMTLQSCASLDVFIIGAFLPSGHPNEHRPDCLTDLLLLQIDMSGDPDFWEILKRTHLVVEDALAHKELSFQNLVKELYADRDLKRDPLCKVAFGFGNLTMPQMALPELTLEMLDVEYGTSAIELTLWMAETEDGLAGTFEYNTALFDATTVDRLAAHLHTVLEALASNPERHLSEALWMSPQEMHQRADWNKTDVDYPLEHCLHRWFEDVAKRIPDTTAVLSEDQCITFRLLNHRANQLARYLQRMGVRPEVLVGVCMERSLELVIALLGILKAGGAYMPLDPEYPKERLAFMLQDARPPVVLAQQNLASILPDPHVRTLFLDTEWEVICQEETGNPESGVVAENTAYMIYTSGSTGRPKGVMNTHRGIVNRLLWMQDAYQLNETDAVLQKTPFSFDVSVWEFFWPLMTGARLVMAIPGGHRDPAYLASAIIQQQISTIHFVPSMLRVFLQEPRVKACSTLKRVICSGEALPLDLQEHLLARMKAELHNLYGPTEAAVDVTYWRCASHRGQHGVPIGRPIANTQLHILDRQMRPSPVGVAGELYIGGAGLARGYFNRPELTAEKFIPCPFGHDPGARLYRTGDLARYRADGVIEYLGRLDHQAKIRGVRIELGEIETLLSAHPAVRVAVVLIREDTHGDQRLVAYIIPSRERIPMVSDFRSYLQTKLPHHMIPSRFVILDTLPLTPSGKVDRRALPAPEAFRPKLARQYVMPNTEMEQRLAAIWASVLKVKQVGVNDDFFELGGHSLLAAQVVSRVRQDLQIELPLRAFFDNPSLADLAKEAERLRRQGREQAFADSSLREDGVV